MPARIVVTEFVSLDGVMEAPGGEPDFQVPGLELSSSIVATTATRFKLEETRGRPTLC